MRKQRVCMYLAALASLVVMLTAAQSKALMIAPPALPIRVATADLIVLGMVKSIGDKTESADMFKDDTRKMKIATVRVDETVMGKGVREVKVAFFPPTAAPPGRPIRGGIRRASVQLTMGQEAALFLKKHPTKDCYVVSTYFEVISKTDNENFAKEVGEIKKYAAMLANPTQGLKSKDDAERFTTAALLIARYRNPKPEEKLAPIPAAESKLILNALADADWTNQPGRFNALTPLAMFYRLGLTEKDGWKQPEDGRDTPAAAKKWLKDNAGKYRIQRYVTAKAEKPAKSDTTSSSDK